MIIYIYNSLEELKLLYMNVNIYQCLLGFIKLLNIRGREILLIEDIFTKVNN